jgi:DNA polymerase/3'-5' exonuclease PolX
MSKQNKVVFGQRNSVLAELTLAEAEELACQVILKTETFCERFEIVGSIRRKRPKVHDIDFVVIAKNDLNWSRLGEELKRMKARTICSGNSVIKTNFPHSNSCFQIDFYRAKPTTFGILKLILTGSADHNMWLSSYTI